LLITITKISATSFAGDWLSQADWERLGGIDQHALLMKGVVARVLDCAQYLLAQIIVRITSVLRHQTLRKRHQNDIICR
jgi:hypothetical protein